MDINDYMASNRMANGLVKAVICNDGFRVSIQGSKYAYCSPREDNSWYYNVELGFPSESDELILEYAENIDSPTNTVYGYVPVQIVEELIEKHGGVVGVCEGKVH